MDRSTELRLPTVAVPVKLALVGGDLTSAALFVSDVVRTGHTQLLDDLAGILDDDSTFVPAKIGARVQLVAKHALRWVAVQKEADLPPEKEFVDIVSEVVTLHDRQHVVTVELAGAKLEGTLLDSAPHDRPRAIDHLNASRKFVRLWTSDEHYLINKLQILQVIELSAAGGD